MTREKIMNLYRILGINDDSDVCGVCGKQHLKRVVHLENIETQEVIIAGTTCASVLRKIGIKEQKKEEKEWVKKRAEEVNDIICNSNEYKEYRNATKEHIDWLNANPNLKPAEIGEGMRTIAPFAIRLKKFVEELKKKECEAVQKNIICR